MNILVVDDSQLNLAIARTFLQKIPRISEVVLCSNPADAKTIIDEKNIDILILDVIMPVITGFDILKMLKENKQYEDMPIIMLTSLDDTESFKKCFELGAFDYINKPIHVDEFNARLKVAIDSKLNSNQLKSLIKIGERQNAELKEMNAKLTDTKFHLVQAEKMAAIGQLAAGIAHEINNPMGFVNNNFEILQKYFKRLSEYINFINECFQFIQTDEESGVYKALEEAKKAYKKLKIDVILNELEGMLSESESGVHRVTQIVQALRTFARSVNDDEKDAYSLLDLFNQVMFIIKNETKYVSKVEIDIPEDIIVYCNKVQIGQVFINIIVNAAQAIQSQGRSDMGIITIAAEKKQEYIWITIEDDGPGIPEENLTKIFEPFYTTKAIGQGTGLGLSITYDIIVNKHNGFIDIASTEGKGTVFTVKLPLHIN